MVIDTKENSEKAKRVEKEFITMQMGIDMKVIGKATNDMAVVHFT